MLPGDDMRTNHKALLFAAGTVLLLFCLAACGGGRSSSLRFACCALSQHSDPLTALPRPGTIRLAIGGDSRNDQSHVLPWAFKESRKRGATGFLFLGDMEISRQADRLFARQLSELAEVPFYPVIGNHEVEFLGAIRLSGGRHAVREFKEDFLTSPGIRLAPLAEVAYTADLSGVVHFIALDNISRGGEGFGPEQLAWLERDLKAASATRQIILVGMHKPLAKNPITTHAMDEDGPAATRDSDAALALFKQYRVAMVFVSHSHMFASYSQDGVEMRLTGGLGAPLVKELAEADGGFHHFLLLDIKPGNIQHGDGKASLQVEVVKFQGTPMKDPNDESVEH
jgi:hypothetical protein